MLALSFGGDRDDLSLHPTVKPVAMVADAVRDCSHRKAIVLDAFIGSGTTLIAAEKTGRRGYGIEIDPAYCDVTIRRLHAVCGLDAVLGASGQSFGSVNRMMCSTPALVSVVIAWSMLPTTLATKV
jgi:predicted RNA methylase